MIKRKSYKKHLKKEIEFDKFRKKLQKVLEHNIIAIDKKNNIHFLEINEKWYNYIVNKKKED